MTRLHLAKELTLPIEAVTEKLAWLGRTGSGKTYGAMKLAEEMLRAGAQIGVIDPVGVWRALRVPAAKGGQAFDVVVFGGLYGDLPLKDTAGELIADLVVDRGISFVLDVSQFIPSEQQRFVRAFADRFFHRKKSAPSAVHLFLEECQEFIPENPSGDEARTLGVMQRLWKLGRNFGIGGSLISQRPQEIAKKALNMSGTLFAFQMTGPQERKAIRAWVADQGVAVDIEGVLQTLDIGSPIVISPTFLRDERVLHILPRVTADLSSTPKVGVDAAAKRALTQIDVKNLQDAMAATIEEHKANDPRELRRQVADLKKQLVAADRARPPSKTDTKKTAATTELKQQLAQRQRALEAAMKILVKVQAVDFLVDTEEDRKALEQAVAAAVRQVTAPIEKRVTSLVARIEGIKVAAKAAEQAIATLLDEKIDLAVQVQRREPFEVTGTGRHDRPAPVKVDRPVPTGAAADDTRLASGRGYKKHILAILTALAQHADGLTREQTLILAGYQPSGDISTGFAALLEHGWIADGVGRLRITDAGLSALGTFDPLPTGGELRRHLLNSGRLNSAERKLLAALFEFRSRSNGSATRAQIHELAGLRPSGDTSTAFAKFLKLGWVVERDGGLAASDTFFED